MNKIVSIGMGDSSGYAITTEGKVLAWGLNNYAQLANGTKTNTQIATYMQDEEGYDPDQGRPVLRHRGRQLAPGDYERRPRQHQPRGHHARRQRHPRPLCDRQRHGRLLLQQLSADVRWNCSWQDRLLCSSGHTACCHRIDLRRLIPQALRAD